ncbi:MAG: adenosylcobinamide amidohydrolase [Alphaproteobacteria bacterium]
MEPLFRTSCAQPFLVARFAARQRILGWSLNRPGFAEGELVAWLEVRNADLPIGVDPLALLERRLAGAGLAGAIGMMTARDVRRHHGAGVEADGVRADVLVTLGLTNGSVFDPAGRLRDVAPPARAGTINMLVALSMPLDDGAMVEAVSVAAMARSAALLADGGRIVGTGTDCILLACPADGARRPHAGIHTQAGRCIAEAVHAATRAARAEWEAEQGH